MLKKEMLAFLVRTQSFSNANSWDIHEGILSGDEFDSSGLWKLLF